MCPVSGENNVKCLEGFRENLIVFSQCPFLSALEKLLIKSLLNFEPVLKKGL